MEPWGYRSVLMVSMVSALAMVAMVLTAASAAVRDKSASLLRTISNSAVTRAMAAMAVTVATADLPFFPVLHLMQATAAKVVMAAMAAMAVPVQSLAPAAAFSFQLAGICWLETRLSEWLARTAPMAQTPVARMLVPAVPVAHAAKAARPALAQSPQVQATLPSPLSGMLNY